MKPFPSAVILSAIVTCILGSAPFAKAGSATWEANPTSGDWNTAANWTPATVPNGPSDIATFDASSITALSLSASVELYSMVFDSGASPFTLR